MAGAIKGDFQLVPIDNNDISHPEFLVKNAITDDEGRAAILRGEAGIASLLLPPLIRTRILKYYCRSLKSRVIKA